jgi:hypothetical protein
VEGSSEGGDGRGRQVALVDGSVICKVRGDVAEPSNMHAPKGLSAQPGCQSLSYEQVQEWGEWAALADASMPSCWVGLNAIGMRGSQGVGEEQTGPGNHALRRPQGVHDLVEEGTESNALAMSRKRAAPEMPVLLMAWCMRKVCRMLSSMWQPGRKAFCSGPRAAPRTGANQDAVQGGEEGDGMPSCRSASVCCLRF